MKPRKFSMKTERDGGKCNDVTNDTDRTAGLISQTIFFLGTVAKKLDHFTDWLLLFVK